MATNTFQRKNVYKDFDLSFSRNPLTNDISTKTDINAINQSLRTLMYTNFGERGFRPDVGSNLTGQLFEPADIITALEIKNAIKEVIRNYETRVEVIDVQIFDDMERNAYVATLIYRMNMTSEPIELKVTLKRLR